MILMSAIILYGQFMSFMQPCITIYDSVFISYFLYSDFDTTFFTPKFQIFCRKEINFFLFEVLALISIEGYSVTISEAYTVAP